MTIGIYKITNPEGKSYIGQSTNIEKRWKTYREFHCKSQPTIYDSLKKYGYLNHKFEIICECLKKELNELEQHYITYYNTLNTDVGLNGFLTKIHPALGRKHTPEAIAKMRLAKQNMSDETRKKMSESRKGNKNAVGYIPTKEHRDKLSKALSGKKKHRRTKAEIENDKLYPQPKL